MAVEKKNTYVPGSNNDITNAVENIDLNRLGFDRTQVSWNGSSYDVQIGSLIECNGSLYAVEGTVENIGTGNGIVFFDSSTELFSISDEDIEYNPTRAGWYSTATATKRATKYSIDGRRKIIDAYRELGTNVDYEAEFEFNGRVNLLDVGAFDGAFGIDAFIDGSF